MLVVAFALEGRVGRSGNAEGMDEALTRGILEASRMRADGRIMGEVYLPKPNFRNWAYKDIPYPDRYFIYTDESELIYHQAQEIVSKIHPAWHNCNEFARSAHTRNVFQVLSLTLDIPSDYLICYAEPNGKKGVKGGTATAYALAQEYGVKCYNLYYEKQQNKALDYLGITRERWLSLAGK